LRAAARLRRARPGRAPRQPSPGGGRLRRGSALRAQRGPPGRARRRRGVSPLGAAGPVGGLCRRGAGSVGAVTTASSPTLAERLGYGPEDRLLIINCDDLGSCHAANVGTYEALRD